MNQEIESVKPILTVIDDEGDLVLSSTGPRGKAMVQAVLALANGVRKITIVQDGEMKVMKRSGKGQEAQAPQTAAEYSTYTSVAARYKAAVEALASGPDIQDQFAADLEAGRTGEIATGEAPSPTPGPSDPVKIPSARRKPQIFQDAAAPPAPELAEAEMDRLLQEAAQAERDAAKVAEDQRFQRQQAIQSGDDSVPVADEAPAKPRKRERNLAINGSSCGNCGGSGQSVRVDSTGSYIPDEHGRPLSGVCQVCSGSGQIKSWGRTMRR